MEGFSDEVVDRVRAVEVAGVDVVDAGFERGLEDLRCVRGIGGRAVDFGAGELHGSEADAVYGEGA